MLTFQKDEQTNCEGDKSIAKAIIEKHKIRHPAFIDGRPKKFNINTYRIDI